jgi:hypothetical protein
MVSIMGMGIIPTIRKQERVELLLDYLLAS